MLVRNVGWRHFQNEFYESLVKAGPFEMFGKLPAMLNPELISAAMKELLALNFVRSFNLAIYNAF